MRRLFAITALLLGAVLFGAAPLRAQSLSSPAPAPAAKGQLSISFGGPDGAAPDLGVSIQVLLLMTLLTLGPSLVIMMTSFTRIVIVLGFVRTALGTPATPPTRSSSASGSFSRSSSCSRCSTK